MFLRPHRSGPAVAALSITLFACVGHAHADYDEGISGDLSNDPLSPTAVPFSLGSNLVSGSMGSSNDVVNGDRDFLTFTIAPGQELSGLFLTAMSPDNLAFHAISAGPTSVIPSGPGAGDVSTYLGSNHLGPANATLDLLPILASPLAGTGFTPPLGPGTYAYMVQQTSPITQTYTLDFVVTPEPASVALLGIGLLGLTRRRR